MNLLVLLTAAATESSAVPPSTSWVTSLDWPNLVVGGIIGFFLGFGANLLTWRIGERVERNRLRARFGKIAGEYTGYSQKANGDEFDFDGKTSRATVKYQHDNLLTIEVIDPEGQTWEGEITMEGKLRGSIGWRYKSLNHPAGIIDRRLRFGLKTCLLIPATDDLPDSLCVIGDKDEGYGRELFKKAGPKAVSQAEPTRQAN